MIILDLEKVSALLHFSVLPKLQIISMLALVSFILESGNLDFEYLKFIIF